MAKEISILSNSMRVTLVNKDLWSKFNEFGTEMVITKNGRRMFPYLELSFEGLDPNEMYVLLLDMYPAGRNKFKFSERFSRWTESCSLASTGPIGIYRHPEGPFKGSSLKNPIKFNKVKLSNTFHAAKIDQISLESMCRYSPRVTVLRYVDYRKQDTSKAFVFTFRETAFFAVTAYLNKQITKLKIDNNPFATGFREERMTQRSDVTKNNQSRHKVKQGSYQFHQYGYENIVQRQDHFSDDNDTNDVQTDTDVKIMSTDDAEDTDVENTDVVNTDTDLSSEMLMYSVSTGEDTGDDIQVLHVNPSSIIVTDVPPSPSSLLSRPERTSPSDDSTINLATARDSIETKSNAMETESSNQATRLSDSTVTSKAGLLSKNISSQSDSHVVPRGFIALEFSCESTQQQKSGQTVPLYTQSETNSGDISERTSKIDTYSDDISKETRNDIDSDDNSRRMKVDIKSIDNTMRMPIDNNSTDDSICIVTDVRSIRNASIESRIEYESDDYSNPLDKQTTERQNTRLVSTSCQVPVVKDTDEVDVVRKDVREGELQEKNTEIPIEHDAQLSKLLHFVNSHPMDVFNKTNENNSNLENSLIGSKRSLNSQSDASKKLKISTSQSDQLTRHQSATDSQSEQYSIDDDKNASSKEPITFSNVEKSRDSKSSEKQAFQCQGTELECNEKLDYNFTDETPSKEEHHSVVDSPFEVSKYRNGSCQSRRRHSNGDCHYSLHHSPSDNNLSKLSPNEKQRCHSEKDNEKPVVKQRAVCLTDLDIHNAIRNVDSEISKQDETDTQSQSRPSFVRIGPGIDKDTYPSTLRVHERQWMPTTCATSPVDVNYCESVDGGDFPVILETYSLRISQQQEIHTQQQQHQDKQQQQQQHEQQQQHQLSNLQRPQQPQMQPKHFGQQEEQQKQHQETGPQKHLLQELQQILLQQQRRIKQLKQQVSHQVTLHPEQPNNEHQAQQQQVHQQHAQQQQIRHRQLQQRQLQHRTPQLHQQQLQHLAHQGPEQQQQQQHQVQQNSHRYQAHVTLPSVQEIHQQHQEQQQYLQQQANKQCYSRQSTTNSTTNSDTSFINSFMFGKRLLLPKQTAHAEFYNRNIQTLSSESMVTSQSRVSTEKTTDHQDNVFNSYETDKFYARTPDGQCQGCYVPSTQVKLEAFYTFGSEFSRSRAPDPRLPEVYCPTRSTFTCYSSHVISSELPIIPQHGYADANDRMR